MKLSVPRKPAAGVYAMFVALATAVPWAGADAPVIVSGSPSGSESLASTAIATDLFLFVVAVSSLATGGRFGGVVTVTVTFAVAVPPLPSLTV